MLRYFGTRILIFIPTLLVISIVAFSLSKMTPGDPVDCGIGGIEEMNLGSSADLEQYEKIYRQNAQDKGLDKPYFYFSFTSAAYPDSLYRILDRFERESLHKLIAQYGNWPQISTYYHQLKTLEKALYTLPKDQSRDGQIEIYRSLQQLKISYLPENMEVLFRNINEVVQKDSFLMASIFDPFATTQQAYTTVLNEASPAQLLKPQIYWHGLNNQYHHWLTRFISRDFGISCRNGQPVIRRIKPAMWWTLVMSIPSLFLAFLIAIPLGIYAAIKRDSWFDRVSTVTLFILYSLPSFWVATMLIVFFTTREYGAYMDVFPSVGLGDLPSSAPLWDRFWESIPHLGLPIFCMTYGSLAFISRQMRTGALRVIREDYIRTAQAKGLAKGDVIWKHIFRNALFPLITMIAMVLPNLIAGAVVIEVIFNIPGMGREMVGAIFARDWPVVYTILMLAAVLTLLGNLLGDLLYAWADPRISFNKK